MNLLRDVHKCLEHKLHIKATAVASIDGELHLRGHSAEHKGLPLSPPSDAEWKPWAAHPIASKGGMQFAGLCDEVRSRFSSEDFNALMYADDTIAEQHKRATVCDHLLVVPQVLTKYA